MNLLDVSEEDAGDRALWMLLTRMADPKELGWKEKDTKRVIQID